MAVGLKDKEDQSLNPGQNHWDAKVSRNQTAANSLSESEQAAFNDIESNYNLDADPSQEDANINNVRNAEESPSGQYDKTPTKTEKKETSQKLSRKQRAMNFMKKKGPLGLIIAVFIGGAGLLGSISTSSLAILNIKNALVQDLNDALTSMDERSQHIMRKRLGKGGTKGFCTSVASFKCRYKSTSTKMAKRLEKAGFTLEGKRKTILGRVKFDAVSYTDSAGEKKTVDPKNYKKEMRTNVEFNSKMMKGYSPRFASFRDGVAKKVYSKFKTSLRRHLSGTKKDMASQIDEDVKKGVTEVDGRKLHKTDRKDADGNPIYEDPDGKEVQLNDEQRKAIEDDGGKNKLRDFEGKNHGLKGMLTNGFRAANFVTGTQAMICHTLGAVNIAALAAKNIKFAELLRYVMPLLNTADSIKTGDGTMEAVEYLGDVATHIDLREKTLNEDEGDLGNVLDGGEYSGNPDDITIKPEKNPHYGQSAFDSAGYKLAAYGEVSNLDMRQSQYKLGGTTGGNKLNGLVDQMRKVPGFREKDCAFYKNPLVQFGGLALSLIGLIGSGGAALPVELAKASAMMIASVIITSYIESMINDIVKGTIADSKTVGLDAGNAWFSGGAALMASTASGHGLSPLSTPKEVAQTQRLAAEVKQRYAEVARYDARDTPFDIYNQYSFLGSIVFKVYPTVAASQSAATMAMFSPFTFLSTALGALSPTASASVTSPPSRFEKCEDPTYNKINLASADQMCNIRFGNSPEEVNADPEKVAEWMIDAGQIDPESGDTKTDSEAVKRVAQVPVTAQEASTVLHDEDDPNPPAQVVSVERGNPNNTPVTLAAEVNSGEDKAHPIEPEAEKNVRTYAHWLRYCRFGVEGGRNVNFGDVDSEGEDSIFSGLGDNVYKNDGRECLKANACKAGENPNGGTVRQHDDGKWYIDEDGEGAMGKRCRPPQYSIYSIFSIDHSILDSTDEDEDEEKNDDTVSGEAKELAKKLTENENIEFADEATKKALLKFSETGEATNFCGKKFTISALLSGTILTLAKNYKILINNFGFQEDRHLACDQGQHPKGNAVDLNGIEKIGGDKTAWGSITFSSSELKVITEYTTDWMDAAAKKDPNRGRVGQLGCGGFDMTKKRKPAWKGPDGSLHFGDACNHLHIDVGDRTDGSKI